MNLKSNASPVRKELMGTCGSHNVAPGLVASTTPGKLSKAERKFSGSTQAHGIRHFRGRAQQSV